MQLPAYRTEALRWRVLVMAFGVLALLGAAAVPVAAVDAEDRCSDGAFTGGELRMVQWIENDLDTNYRCPVAPTVSTTGS